MSRWLDCLMKFIMNDQGSCCKLRIQTSTIQEQNEKTNDKNKNKNTYLKSNLFVIQKVKSRERIKKPQNGTRTEGAFEKNVLTKKQNKWLRTRNAPPWELDKQKIVNKKKENQSQAPNPYLNFSKDTNFPNPKYWLC